MFWLWLVLGIVGGTIVLVALGLVCLYFHLLGRYLDFILRIFQEKPLFIIPRGQPVDDAEDVRVSTSDGLSLRGIYLRATTEPRRGVILFGLEYGSSRWAAVPYCQYLRDAGYDVFACEPRGQGESDSQPGYEPTQWVTDNEVRDMQAALQYLKSRPDADPRGIGFYGFSKGGSAGLLAGSRDRYVRCFATDGIFATRTTMVPYMQKWVAIVSTRYRLQKMLPYWFYGQLADASLRAMRRKTGRRFPKLEHALARLSGRPLFMIHGEADTYIKPAMAERLYTIARNPKELWMVPGAKHNQAFHVAKEEYQSRVLEFFDRHLGNAQGEPFRGSRISSRPIRQQRELAPAQ